MKALFDFVVFFCNIRSLRRVQLRWINITKDSIHLISTIYDVLERKSEKWGRNSRSFCTRVFQYQIFEITLSENICFLHLCLEIKCLHFIDTFDTQKLREEARCWAFSSKTKKKSVFDPPRIFQKLLVLGNDVQNSKL